MSRRTARDLAEDQRKWSDRQSVRQRQDEEAEKLDKRLIEAMSECPRVAGPAGETAGQIEKSRRRVVHAWSMGTIIDDPEIERRVNALSMLMWIAHDDGEMAEHRHRGTSGEPQPTLNPWPITVGWAELREALAYFQRHIDPPPAKLPTSSELAEIGGLDEVRSVLREREAGPLMQES